MVFEGHERLIGQVVPVAVEDASAVTLFGQVVTTESVGARRREGRRRMASQLSDLVGRWIAWGGIDPACAPTAGGAGRRFGRRTATHAGRAPTRADRAWERRHGFRLPAGLRAWLMLSNGFYLETGR